MENLENQKSVDQTIALVLSAATTTMCTVEKCGDIFLLTLTGDNEHRLNPTLFASLLSALAEIKSKATRGSVLITTAHGKFFSNGLDIRYAQAAGSVGGAKDRFLNLVESLKSLVAEFISVPMPTIAAITGHAAAGGLVLALSHDYVIMRSDKGILYMSELDIGMSLPEFAAALIRSKLSSISARRGLLLKAMKVRPKDAVEMGIVDSVHSNGEEAIKAAIQLGEELSKPQWDGKAYAEIRKALCPELCHALGLTCSEVLPSSL